MHPRERTVYSWVGVERRGEDMGGWVGVRAMEKRERMCMLERGRGRRLRSKRRRDKEISFKEED